MTNIVRRVVYFTEEGRVNIPDTLRLVSNRARRSDIDHVIVFTRDGQAALELRQMVPKAKQVLAATFPAHQPFYDDEGNRVSHALAEPKLRALLHSENIPVIMGTMPFSEVFIPRTEDPKLAGISNALRLFGNGVGLCIQSVLMATDAGFMTPGDIVVTMAADTALVVRAASSSYLFHPDEGLRVLEIICKHSPLVTEED